MAKRPIEREEDDEVEPEVAVTHPEEIRLEAQLTIRGRPTARAAIRTTPAGVICVGLAIAAIIFSSGAVVRMIGRAGR
jgi:hypothetical protein